jgi:hypothetical protein
LEEPGGELIIVIQILINRQKEQANIRQDDAERGKEIFFHRYGIGIFLIRRYRAEYTQGTRLLSAKKQEDKDCQHNKRNDETLVLYFICFMPH